MSEATGITYFCPGSCDQLAVEQPRDTGEEYFGPAAGEDEQIDTSLQTGQLLATSVEPKPEPRTFYSLPETCLADAPESVEAETQFYYVIDEAEIDTQPNSSDLRVETGFRYYGTGSMVEITGIVPDEGTLAEMERQRQLQEELKKIWESGEFPSVKYFCTPSCENVQPERQRSTGLTYFGGIDYRSVRYFCPGKCDYMPPESERDTGLDVFRGSAFDEEVYRVNPIPEFGNLSDLRVVSGCHFYGPGRSELDAVMQQ